MTAISLNSPARGECRPVAFYSDATAQSIKNPKKPVGKCLIIAGESQNYPGQFLLVFEQARPEFWAQAGGERQLGADSTSSIMMIPMYSISHAAGELH